MEKKLILKFYFVEFGGFVVHFHSAYVIFLTSCPNHTPSNFFLIVKSLFYVLLVKLFFYRYSQNITFL